MADVEIDIPPFTEYELLFDDSSISDLYDDVDPIKLLDSLVEDGTIEKEDIPDEIDGLDLDLLTEVLLSRFAKLKGYSKTPHTLISYLPASVLSYYVWTVVIIVSVSIAGIVYLRSKYEICLDDEFWGDFTIDDIPDDMVDDGGSVSSDVSIATDVDDSEFQDKDVMDELINRSQVLQSSPIMNYEVSTPLSVSLDLSETGSPVKFSTLSEDIYSSPDVTSDSVPFILDTNSEIELKAATNNTMDDLQVDQGTTSETVPKVIKPESNDPKYSNAVTEITNVKPPSELERTGESTPHCIITTAELVECIDESEPMLLLNQENEESSTFEGSPKTPPSVDVGESGLTSFANYLTKASNSGRVVLEEVTSPSNIPPRLLTTSGLSPSPSRIPRRSINELKSKPPGPTKQCLQISEPVLSCFFGDLSKEEEYLDILFDDDPVVKFDVNNISKLTRSDIDSMLVVFEGKETSQNWTERYNNLDVLIGLTRLHLPEGHYLYFQDKLRLQLADMISILRTTRTKLLGKSIIFIRDLAFFGSELAVSKDTYTTLVRSLLTLTRESQASKRIQKLSQKSLCIMSQTLTITSFIENFDTVFANTLRDRKMKGEKFTCLLMIKFSILMNKDKFTEDEVKHLIGKLSGFIPDLSTDPYQKTRAEVLELYLILKRIHPTEEDLLPYYEGLSTFQKSQVLPPGLKTLQVLYSRQHPPYHFAK